MRRFGGCLFVLAGAIMLLASPFVWNAWLPWRYQGAMYTSDEAPQGDTAIVFGAAVYANGRLSPMLRDRMDTAISLYQSGKVKRLLFSGSGSRSGYNEPDQMTAYAMEQGVPAAAIQPDYAGQRTYDTCYRAVHVFELESAILVTQAFHLPRALFTCNSLGLDAAGVIADRRMYHPVSLAWSENREFLASILALIDVVRGEPAAIVGEPMPLE